MKKILLLVTLLLISVPVVYGRSSDEKKKEEEILILIVKANSMRDEGHWNQAIVMYEEAIHRRPEPKDLARSKARRWAQNNLAWLLATCPDRSGRNGERAVALAEELVTYKPRDAAYLDSLAAAYAEAGRFDDAVKTEQNAMSLASRGDDLIKQFQDHLNAYMYKKPWRMSEVIRMHQEVTWTISVIDFDKLDTDHNARLIAAELVPSLQEAIDPVVREFLNPRIPPDIAKLAKTQTAVRETMNELSKHFAEQAIGALDTDVNGYLSREEVAARQGKPLPFYINFTLRAPSQ